jgi:hypothetical protein
MWGKCCIKRRAELLVVGLVVNSIAKHVCVIAKKMKSEKLLK